MKRVLLSVARSMMLEVAEVVHHIADPSSVAEPDPAVREEVTRIGRPIVEVVRTDVELDRAEAVSRRRTIALGPSDDATSVVYAELARIEHATLPGMLRVLGEFGEPQPQLRRSVALTKQARLLLGQGSFNRGSTWKSARLSAARFRSPGYVSRHFRRVKTTRRVDSHFCRPAIHTSMTAQPLARKRLAGPRPDRPWPDGPLDRGRERPHLWTPW